MSDLGVDLAGDIDWSGRSLPPLTIAAARFLVALLLLAGIVIYRKDKVPTRTRDLIRLAYPGLYMFGLSYGLIYSGMEHVDSALSAILIATYPFFVAAMVQMIFGGSFLVAGALLFENWRELSINPASVGSILYLAIPGTAFTFLGYYWLLKRIKVTVLSLIAFVTPLIVILLGILVADETFTLTMSLGAALIVGGVFIVARK